MKYQFESNKIDHCELCFIKIETILGDTCGKGRRLLHLEQYDKPNWCPLVEVQDE